MTWCPDIKQRMVIANTPAGPQTCHRGCLITSNWASSRLPTERSLIHSTTIKPVTAKPTFPLTYLVINSSQRQVDQPVGLSWVKMNTEIEEEEWGLHRSARDVTTGPGSIPGCVSASCDRETHEAAHNWHSVVRVRGGVGRPGYPCPIEL